MLTITIGDIHGMAHKLERLIALLDDWLGRWGALSPRYVFLGDYIDRGPDSRDVLDRVRSYERQGAVCLRGNHEELMIRSNESKLAHHTFLIKGGSETMQSFGNDAAFAEAREWMRSLPTSFEDDTRYYVHAGVRPGILLSQQSERDKLWIRDEFLNYQCAFPKYIVHGHTPTNRSDPARTAPEIFDNRCNVDTGAAKSGPLSAVIFSAEDVKPIHVISAWAGS